MFDKYFNTLFSSCLCFLLSSHQKSQGSHSWVISVTHSSSKWPVVGSLPINTGLHAIIGISMIWTQGAGSAAGADWVRREMERMRRTVMNIFVAVSSSLFFFFFWKQFYKSGQGERRIFTGSLNKLILYCWIIRNSYPWQCSLYNMENGVVWFWLIP